MSNVVKAAWASAKINKDFIYLETYSGYASTRADPQGVEHFLSPDVDDNELGLAVLDALAHSRFVLPEPSKDVWIHPDATFDMELYDLDLHMQRYDQWVNSTLKRYGYKTKRALFKDMKSCDIQKLNELITISPNHHDKLEAWSGDGFTKADNVIIPASSSSAEVGAALRVVFGRCT